MEFIFTLISAIGGYISFKLASTPGSRINRRVPQIKIKNIQFLPSIKITVRGRMIHLHHWLCFSILLCVSVFVSNGILSSWITRGFLAGGVVQGLRFPDRGHIFKKISG